MTPYAREQLATRDKRDLTWFAEERKVTPEKKNVVLWSRISQWQRERLVKLRWDGRADYCFVSLTEEGRKRMAHADTR